MATRTVFLGGQETTVTETEEPVERFDVDEFLRRVAEREGIGAELAEKHAKAAFVGLEHTLSNRAFVHLRSKLSSDFLPLLPLGPAIEIMPAESFTRRVADRAGIDADQARRRRRRRRCSRRSRRGSPAARSTT
jgi:hypothetical protein